MALTHLLKPIAINKLEVKNRILRTGHGTYYGRGSITDDLIAYHEARARSGVGLTTLEVTCVHRSSVNNIRCSAGMTRSSPAFVRYLQRCTTMG